jgi:hypothetical protein
LFGWYGPLFGWRASWLLPLQINMLRSRTDVLCSRAGQRRPSHHDSRTCGGLCTASCAVSEHQSREPVDGHVAECQWTTDVPEFLV